MSIVMEAFGRIGKAVKEEEKRRTTIAHVAIEVPPGYLVADVANAITNLGYTVKGYRIDSYRKPPTVAEVYDPEGQADDATLRAAERAEYES